MTAASAGNAIRTSIRGRGTMTGRIFTGKRGLKQPKAKNPPRENHVAGFRRRPAQSVEVQFFKEGQVSAAD